MIQLEDLRLAAALAKAPSLSAAARALSVTPPALSIRLKRLEAQLGLHLAVRSAHRLSLTPEGERLAVEGAALLQRLEELPDTLQSEGRALGGRVRISAPFGFGRAHVAPLLATFSAEHPRITLALDLLETPWPDHRNADVVVHIGEVRDSSWIAHPLLPNERWLCASPSYLKAHRFMPQDPREVVAHPCICIRENDEDVTLWHYRKRTKRHAPATKRESLRIIPTLTTNDGGVARQWCERGLGLVLRSEWDAAPAIARGALVRLLPQWDFGSAPAIALVPARSGMPARVRALVEHLQSNLRGRSMQ